MIKRDIEELFAPRIIGARWIEEHPRNETELFMAAMFRQSLEDMRDQLLEGVKREQLSPTHSKISEEEPERRDKRKQTRRPRQSFFRFNRAA